MKKFFSTLTAGGLLACSTGCLKNESKSVVNADGSGKFSMTVEMNLAPLQMFAGGSPEAMKAMTDTGAMLTQMMRGMGPTVDAWTEAKAETTKAGITKITLSGLTKDFTASGDLKKALQSSGGSAALNLDSMPDLKMISSTKDASGNWIISMAGLDEVMTLVEAGLKQAGENGMLKPGQIKVTKAELEAGLKDVRAKYAQMKGMAAMMLQDMLLKYELQVAGEIQSTSVFKKTAPDTVTYSFSGAQLLEMVDDIVSDDALAGKIVTLADALNEGPESDKPAKAIRTFLEPYVKNIMGGTTAPKVVIKPAAKPVFDYAAEVAKAKAGMSPQLKKLVDEAARPAPSASDASAPESGEAKPKPAAPKKKAA